MRRIRTGTPWLAVFLLLACACFPTRAAAEPVESKVPLDFKASLFARYELRQNPDGVGVDSDSIRYRTRLGLILGPLDGGRGVDVSLHFVPQASGTWEVGGDTIEDADLDLHEGFLQFGNDLLMVEVGRLELVYGDHLVLGNVDWNPTGRSFDAARMRFSTKDSEVVVDALVSIITEGGTPSFARGDLYFAGVYAALGKSFAEGFEFDLYALTQLRRADPANAVAKLARLTLGLRAKNRVGSLDYRFEAGIQTGKNSTATILAGQVDLEAGLNLLADKLRLSVEGGFASGDNPDTARDEAYDQLYPTAHKWLGASDIIGGRTNIATGVLHVTGVPVERVKIYLDAHTFVRPREMSLVGSGAGATGSGFAAVEIDSGLIYTIATGLRARVGYALFLPMENVYGTQKPAHFAELELRYDRKP